MPGVPVHSPRTPSTMTDAFIGASKAGRGGALPLSSRIRCASWARAERSCEADGRGAPSGTYAGVREHAARDSVRKGRVGGGHEAQVLVVLHAVADDLQAEARQRDADGASDVRGGPRIEEVSVARAAEPGL